MLKITYFYVQKYSFKKFNIDVFRAVCTFFMSTANHNIQNKCPYTTSFPK